MSDPRTFISFDFDHNSDEKILFAGQAKNSKTPFDISDWSSKSSLPQNEWEELIEAKINKCNMVIVLVGKYMASATGVVKEISFAKKNNVPVFGVHVDEVNTSNNLPTGLSTGRTITWDWAKIASAIDQMMGEGKNK